MVAAVVGSAGAVAIGIAGIERIGPWLAVFIAIGGSLVLAYNLELFGGWAHTGLGFALGWGAFPVLVAAFAQDRSLTVSAVVLAAAATLLSAAQRSLSTPARAIRRRAVSIEGRIVFSDGKVEELGCAALRCSRLSRGPCALCLGRPWHWRSAWCSPVWVTDGNRSVAPVRSPVRSPGDLSGKRAPGALDSGIHYRS